MINRIGEHVLNRDLTDYNQLNRTPFHMPGHKRQNLTGVDLPYEKDYTEVEGLDDLHHPEGILKAAMERTAAMYGVDRTWYLVGGSTVGNLAGLYALAPYGSEVICTRVMHRSILHGLMLAGYRVHYVMPDYVEELGCYGGVRAEAVKEILIVTHLLFTMLSLGTESCQLQVGFLFGHFFFHILVALRNRGLPNWSLSISAL